MTSSPRWYTRPGVVLPLVAGLAVASALLTRERVAGREGDARLSTYSTQPQGAGVLYDLARRLGWRVERRLTSELPAATDRIHAVLDAAVPLRTTEVHALLEQVRGGAALLVVLGPGRDPIGDSLHIGIDDRFGSREVRAEPAAGCSRPVGSFTMLWGDSVAHLYGLAWRAPPPPDVEDLVVLGPGARASDPGPRPALIGFPYGRGRVVVASDPDMLRNDVLRWCGFGLDVRAVRALEYLSAGGPARRTTVVFDEFHQGYGAQPGTVRAVASYLLGQPSGHLLFQLLAAGLVLLLALAPRAIPPRDPALVERRSPLEHVDALARAYAQVGATRTAAERLVRGARRRLERGSAHARGAGADDAFLKRLEDASPGLAPDVAVVRRALAAPLSRRDFEAAGAALQRIETTLTRR